MSRIFTSIVSGMLGVGVLAMTGSNAHALIGVNVTYNGSAADANSTDPTIMAAGDTTGVVSQANWNTVTMRDWYEGIDPFYSPVLGINTTKMGHPTDGVLNDSTGTATNVNVISDKGLNWFTPSNAAYAGTTATEKMLFGFAQANTTGNTTFDINNLTAPSYDIYVYFANNVSVNSIVTIGATSYYFSTAAGQQSSFTQITNTIPGVFTQTGNYAKFSGVAPIGGTIEFAINEGTGITGLQIDVPEPSTAALIGLGSIVSLMIRRRKSA